MKKLCVLLLMFSNTVFADVGQNVNIPVTANTGVDARNQSVSTSTGSDLSRQVGMAVAPSLTTTFSETCMGSTSMGAGFAGGSLSLGTTWEDIACIRRLDSREIKAMGDTQAAKELLCNNEEVRQAFKRVGRPCVIDGGTYAHLDIPTKSSVNDISKKRMDALYEAAVIEQETKVRTR